MEAELQQSQHVVAILSPEMAASHWVNAEIDAGMTLLHAGRLHSILFVVAARCEVPLLLQRWKWIEEPTGTPVSVAEAIAKTVRILGRPSQASATRACALFALSAPSALAPQGVTSPPSLTAHRSPEQRSAARGDASPSSSRTGTQG